MLSTADVLEAIAARKESGPNLPSGRFQSQAVRRGLQRKTAPEELCVFQTT